MKITLPISWVEIDPQTGALPEILVGETTNNWLDLVSYWNALGYFMVPGTGPTVDLIFPFPPGILKERNSYMPVPWWESLCNTTNNPTGEVIGWQAVWQLHPTVYDQGFVPLLIPNSSYMDDSDPPVSIQRLWKQWGSSSHSHYYLPAEAGINEGLTNDRYFIPTWSWGSDITGLEMMYGQNEQGVNIVSRQDFQSALNAEQLQVVPVTPSP